MKKRGLSLVLATIFTTTLVLSNTFHESIKVNAAEDKQKYASGYKAPKIKVIRSSEKPTVKSVTLPTKYDSRDFGYVTAVKNQGQIGDCWAFTTYGALDSFQKKNTNKDFDFSEIHLAANNGQAGADEGGNMFYSMSYFMRGKGPVLEKDDPYPNPPSASNVHSNVNAPVNYTVDDVSLLPDRTSAYDNNYIKENVMKYGGVYTSIFLEGYNDNIIKDNKYLNVPKGLYTYPDHAVVIVGWDDNFPKENFPNAPAGNGAFICKNSWGESFGDKGYIYISYYDAFVGTDNAVIPTLTKKSQYDKRNSYGDNFATYAIGSSYGSNFAASTYTASEDQYVNSVGVFSDEQDITFNLYIEEDYGTNKFTNILNKKVKTVKIHDAGFHTIKLDTPVKISAGKTYAVAFGNDAQYLYVEKDTTKYPYENNNFVSFGGQSWMNGYDGVFIVTNTTKVPQYPITGITLDKSSLSLGYNGKYKLSATIMPQNADNKTIYWTSSNPSVATVDEDGNVTGMRSGSAVITAATIDGKVKASTNVTVSSALTIVNFIGQDEYTILTANPVWTLKFNDAVTAGPSYNNIYVVDSSGKKSLATVTINYNEVRIAANTSDFNGGALKLVIPKDAFLDSANSAMSSQVEKNYYINYKSGIKVSFKDSVLEKAVRDNIGKATGDIYSEDMAKITSLDIQDEPLWNLSGIEYAVNLNDLSIYNTEIIDITPISNLFSLESLSLYNNNVNSIKPLSNLRRLNNLYLEDEDIKDLSPITTLSNLDSLGLSGCKVSDISLLSGLTNLRYLSLDNNFITDITPIASLKKLIDIYLEGNQIKDISPLLKLPTEEEYYTLYGMNRGGSIDLDSNLVFNSSDSTSTAIKTNLQSNGWSFYSIYATKDNLNLAKVNDNYYSEYSSYMIDPLTGFNISFNANIQKGSAFENIKLKDYYGDQEFAIAKSISGNKLIIKPLENLDSSGKYELYIPDNAISDYSQNNLKAISTIIRPLNYLKGDSNGDGKVDALDLATVASHYDETVTYSTVKWDLKKDWNKDGVIDIFDITTVAGHIQ